MSSSKRTRRCCFAFLNALPLNRVGLPRNERAGRRNRAGGVKRRSQKTFQTGPVLITFCTAGGPPRVGAGGSQPGARPAPPAPPAKRSAIPYESAGVCRNRSELLRAVTRNNDRYQTYNMAGVDRGCAGSVTAARAVILGWGGGTAASCISFKSAAASASADFPSQRKRVAASL